ncbi:MAG TPA: hypothetical protein VFN92_08630 [Solirubrobacterales bacterium]|nr:hypothetical protein [Solirubrobacterales bacterium]
MALSDDQKAILRLLSQRGEQGYEDLSALMGIEADEVYRRAKDAGAALESEGIPAPSIPEPPGGGDSPSVARAGEAPPGESPPPPAISKPEEPTPSPPALPKGKPRPPLRKEIKLLEGRGLWALLAGAAVVILFVVFVLFGGGDDGGGDSTTASSPSEQGTVAALEKAAEQGKREVTKASLAAVDDSDATGVAVFGRVKNTLALQVAAEGLEPAEEGEGYTIWLAASPQKMLPLASTEVGEDGRIGAQVEVPTEVLAYLASETFRDIAITRTEESQLKASLRKATKAKAAPVYTGDEVLRGEVTGPIVGAAKK